MVIRIQSNQTPGVLYEIDLSKPPIGIGGTGQVFRGVRVETASGSRRDVAVKFLFEDLPASVVDRSRREASIHIKHENLVEMIDFVPVTGTGADGISRTRIHVVSELLTGVMLSDVMNGKTVDSVGNSVPYAEELYELYQKDRFQFTVTVTKQILSGLMAFHNAGYIHRDIDPSNVMITSDGKIKLMDFGIAITSKDSLLIQQEKFIGKADYAAPELASGDIARQTPATDLYAVGIVMFQMFTGELPFTGTPLEILNQQINVPVSVYRIENEGLREVVGKATIKSQSRRFQTAAEFYEALEEISQVSNEVVPAPKKQKKNKKEPEPEPVVEPEPVPVVEPEPVAEPTPEPAPLPFVVVEPEPVDEPEPEPVVEPEPVPEVEPEPVPEPEPEPEPAPTETSEEEGFTPTVAANVLWPSLAILGLLVGILIKVATS